MINETNHLGFHQGSILTQVLKVGATKNDDGNVFPHPLGEGRGLGVCIVAESEKRLLHWWQYIIQDRLYRFAQVKWLPLKQ